MATDGIKGLNTGRHRSIKHYCQPITVYTKNTQLHMTETRRHDWLLLIDNILTGQKHRTARKAETQLSTRWNTRTNIYGETQNICAVATVSIQNYSTIKIIIMQIKLTNLHIQQNWLS